MVEPASYELITLIKRLSVRLHQSIDLSLKPYDMARSQYVMLYHLNAQSSLTGTELCERMMVEPATLSGIVDSLVSKGLVERVERTDDKRRKDIRLTVAGREQLKKIPPPGPVIEHILLKGVSKEENETFKRLCTKMLDNLENELDMRKGD